MPCSPVVIESKWVPKLLPVKFQIVFFNMVLLQNCPNRVEREMAISFSVDFALNYLKVRLILTL